MTGLVSYINSYFEPIARVDRVCLGQVALVPVPNLDISPKILEASRATSTSHETAVARYVDLKDSHFTRQSAKSQGRLPVLGLGKGDTEEIMCFKAKRRPAIAVATEPTTATKHDGPAKAHHVERRFVFAPVYGLSSEDDPYGFGSILATRIFHLLCRQFFPFAEWKETRTDQLLRARSLEYGIVRFDRLQFLVPEPPTVIPLPVKLSREAMSYLHRWLWAYLHADLDNEMMEVHSLLKACLPDEAT